MDKKIVEQRKSQIAYRLTTAWGNRRKQADIIRPAKLDAEKKEKI